jgi:hypothetical protein
MDPIEEQLFLYPYLSPEEQQAVAAYLEQHPEGKALRDEALALAALWAQARRELNAPDEALLAWMVATRALRHHPMSEEMQSVFARLEAHLQAYPDVPAQVAALEARRLALESASDPLVQFERLSGLRLEGLPAPVVPAQREDRLARPRLQRLVLPAWHRYAVAASVLLVALYGALFLAGQRTFQLSIPPDDPGLQAPMPRGEAVVVDARYRQALQQLVAARSTTLGLFPRYDRVQIKTAQGLLTQVLVAHEPGTFLHCQAAFYLGQTHLLLAEPAAARNAFREALQPDCPRHDEAAEALRQLETP